MSTLALTSQDLSGLIAVTGAFSVALVAIVMGTLKGIHRVRAREQTKREIAAYVAEGSISPDDAAKLLNAGGSIKDQIKQKLREKIGA